MRQRIVVATVSGMLCLAGLVVPPVSVAAPVTDLPSHASVVSAARLAADYYRGTYATTTLTPKNGWSWATYFQGVHDLYLHSGDARYQADGMAWGQSNAWGLDTVEANPNTIKAGQDYFALNQVDPAASLAAMDSRMQADLTGLPVSQYDWIDALFMGLPDWALWARRTGNPAYLDKMDAIYAWARNQGAAGPRCAGRTPSQPGLYDATAKLWYRDCSFVGAKDANGRPIFWSRGNGWVIAAMADVLQALPTGDARATKYADMLRTMAASLAPLQGNDGFWRASLANPDLFPQPETSGTALITYALAYGVRAGILDATTYLPVIASAWHGMSTTALRPSGFLTYCQPQGLGPRAPYTASAPRTPPSSTSSGTVNEDSQPFCVGAFLMAAAQVADLVPTLSRGRPVTATAQQTGNEAPRIVDGNVTTRWSASGFPQSVTVDLGSAVDVGSTMVVPYLDRAYRYRIESSTERATWRLLVDRTANVSRGSALNDFTPVKARYVRLTVTGVSGDPTTWASIQEFAVYPPPTTPATTTFASDTFTRTASNGWGSADTGGAWTPQGSASDFTVSGGLGRIRIPSPGAGRTALLSSVSAADVDIRVDTSFDKAMTAGGAYVAVIARNTGTSHYRATVKKVSSGAITISIDRIVNGQATKLAGGTVSGLVAGPTEALRIRFAVKGSGTRLLDAKVWKTTAAEPAAWQATASDTTSALQGPGGIGVWTYLSGSATNAPVTTLVDNVTATP